MQEYLHKMSGNIILSRVRDWIGGTILAISYPEPAIFRGRIDGCNLV